MVDAAVVLVNFSLDCPKLKPLTDYDQYEHFIIPTELYLIRDTLNEKYACIYPFDFRCALYRNRFEMMGVLKYTENIYTVSAEITEILQKLQYEFTVNIGLGQVSECYANDKDALHKINGSAVNDVFKKVKLNSGSV